MAIKSLLRFGNAQLARPAKKVDVFNDPELVQLIQDLSDTMHKYNGVGIAAPQIGVDLRVTVFGFDKSSRYTHAKPVPRTVLINPEFTPLDQASYDDWEGCLSLIGIRGLVRRYRHIRYWGYDLSGNQIEREASGFHARLVQHEIDHLNGYLYPSRLSDARYFGYEEEMTEWRQQLGEKLT